MARYPPSEWVPSGECSPRATLVYLVMRHLGDPPKVSEKKRKSSELMTETPLFSFWLISTKKKKIWVEWCGTNRNPTKTHAVPQFCSWCVYIPFMHHHKDTMLAQVRSNGDGKTSLGGGIPSCSARNEQPQSKENVKSDAPGSLDIYTATPLITQENKRATTWSATLWEPCSCSWCVHIQFTKESIRVRLEILNFQKITMKVHDVFSNWRSEKHTVIKTLSACVPAITNRFCDQNKLQYHTHNFWRS